MTETQQSAAPKVCQNRALFNSLWNLEDEKSVKYLNELVKYCLSPNAFGGDLSERGHYKSWSNRKKTSA